MPRPLHRIAQEIKKEWGDEVNYAAKPYLAAMATLTSVDDMYIMDTGKSVVTYFLCNATCWRGKTAKRIKAELKDLLQKEES